MANKTYLELTFNGFMFKRENITHEPKRKVYRYCKNLPKGVEIEFRITSNNLQTGKLYHGKISDNNNSNAINDICSQTMQ